jgi:hypothetical protein
VRVLKSGSFGFAEELALCVGAKPNVPLVWLAKIVFKKCAVEKNKNTEALAFRVGCLMVRLSRYFMFISVVHSCCVVF